MTNEKNAALAANNREHIKIMTSQEKQFKKELEVGIAHALEERNLIHSRLPSLIQPLDTVYYDKFVGKRKDL